MAKFKVGDVVVGNELASKYGITETGWIGVVTTVDEINSGMIWAKPYWGIDGDRYHVDAECFDLYQTPVIDPIKVSKQELLDILSAQNDCYYSLAQVVEMINKIEDPKPEPVTPGMIMLKEADYDSFLDKVRERLEANFGGYSGDKFIDLGTAEFSLSGNEIELDSVELDSDEVVDTAMECLENVLNNYVVVLEKSEALEA